LFPGVRTTKNCATATLVARRANSSQPPVWVPRSMRCGAVTATAAAETARK
jgi:hypothetical protein